MARFLLAVFLLLIGYKFIANIPAIFKSEITKQQLLAEAFEKSDTEKEEKKKDESETKYTLFSYSRIHQPVVSIVSATVPPSSYSKPNSGYTNPTFIPPNTI